jgi:hypothetical protein
LLKGGELPSGTSVIRRATATKLKKGAATFQFLAASGPGQPLEFQEIVMVSCKVRNTALPSATPDGYWNRIASML